MKKLIPLFESSYSSKFYVGGDILTPDRLEIGNRGVTYKKRNKHLIGVDETFMPYSKISGVEIDRRIIKSDIIIHSVGSQKIIAKDFLVSDAKKIKEEIEANL